MYPTWIWLRELAVAESGTSCRRCGDVLPRNDRFGTTEAVCRPCRKGRDG